MKNGPLFRVHTGRRNRLPPHTQSQAKVKPVSDVLLVPGAKSWPVGQHAGEIIELQIQTRQVDYSEFISMNSIRQMPINPKFGLTEVVRKLARITDFKTVIGC